MTNSISVLPGLYIHVPFCISKCPYCDFYSNQPSHPHESGDLVGFWLTALEIESRIYSEKIKRFNSIYIGGGTPSFLSIEQLKKLFKILHDNFKFEDGSEITLELNPNDVTFEKVKFLYDAGVNRISLGVQSFDDDILQFLGRRHTAHENIRAIKLIREIGLKNLSIDLMYGIFNQSDKSLSNTLDEALSYAPEHISCYQLTIKENTRFWKMVKDGKIKPLSEKKEAKLFLKISDYFESNGYTHYEISSFAKTTKYYSKHNSKYWEHKPYLGLSASAHSFIGKKRWWNVKSVDEYIVRLKENKLPIDSEEELTEEQLNIEKIMLKLRTNFGIDRSILARFHDFENSLIALEKKGYIKVLNNKVYPTKKGFLVADGLADYFVALPKR